MDKYQITFNTWNKVASLYQEKFMDVDLYNDSYDKFCKEIKEVNPSILEVGCGPGNISKYLLKQRPDFRIKAIDVAHNMLQLAKKNNPTVQFEEMDGREIHRLKEKFDGIMVGFCLPYLSKEDAVKLIQDSFQLLNDNGLLYFSFIEGDYENSGYETGSSGDKAFVYYHQEAYLKNVLQQQQFEVFEILHKDYPKGDTEIQTHCILIAKKRQIQ
jgi:2-polyprenyl-3-methyl-5-hydroxy-6-metoxy-1,4-benzoquinol methylase